MRKIVFFILFCMSSINAKSLQLFDEINEESSICWTVCAVDPVCGGLPMPKTPVRPPQATLDGHVLTFTSGHADYTLTLFNEDGDEAYTVFVPYDVDVVMLPATLTGSYGIQLDFGGSYVFVSEILL